MKKQFGFTLIELLIVVAIIAILAAIAVPNFLEAQTRAKVSRVKSDLRTLATAIEAYFVDFNKTPPEAGNGPFPNRVIGAFNNNSGILTPAISTPVSYITNSDFRDPFFGNEGFSANSRPDVQFYTYKSYDWEWFLSANPAIQPIGFGEVSGVQGVMHGDDFQNTYGRWRLFSVGPDRDWDNNPTNPKNAFASPADVGVPYDPTNGTVSVGSILRSQKEADQRTWWRVF